MAVVIYFKKLENTLEEFGGAEGNRTPNLCYAIATL